MEQRSRPRIADVAREAGVSKTAVSFAFNRPERLGRGTVARIREVARSLGYEPYRGPSVLRQARSLTLGVLLPQPLSDVSADPAFGTLASGLAEGAEGAGYALLFLSPLQGSLARAVGRGTVDGFVAVHLPEDHPEVEQIRHAGLPMVLLGQPAFPEHGSVAVDDEAGAFAAAEHLLDLGHRQFLVIGVEPPTMPPARHAAGEHAGIGSDRRTEMGRRLDGYRRAFGRHGLTVADERVVVGTATFDGGLAASRQAWDDGLRFTAVLAMSDSQAVGAIGAARDLGLRIPEDLSVVGFDDVELARHVEPPLTTVHQPLRQLGSEAVRLLVDLVDRREGERAEHLRLPTRLIVRRTTTRVAAGGG